jgi:Skp family chaperone for outer membrane proteins
MMTYLTGTHLVCVDLRYMTERALKAERNLARLQEHLQTLTSTHDHELHERVEEVARLRQQLSAAEALLSGHEQSRERAEQMQQSMEQLQGDFDRQSAAVQRLEGLVEQYEAGVCVCVCLSASTFVSVCPLFLSVYQCVCP